MAEDNHYGLKSMKGLHELPSFAVFTRVEHNDNIDNNKAVLGLTPLRADWWKINCNIIKFQPLFIYKNVIWFQD